MEGGMKEQWGKWQAPIRLFCVVLATAVLVSGLGTATASAASSSKYKMKFQINRLESLNGEEDCCYWSSGEDEIYGSFMVIEIAPNGKVLKAIPGAFPESEGVFDDFDDGESRTGDFPARTMVVNRDSQIKVEIVLMEEDGDEGDDYVRAINKGGDKAYDFLTKGQDWKAKTIVKIHEWYLTNVMALPYRIWSLDGDDKLGFDEVPVHSLTGLSSNTIKKTLTAKGSNNGDKFEYKLSYSIYLQNP
jgi:hypothetical protein